MCKKDKSSAKIAYFPKGFFNKEINEPFIQMLLSYFLNGHEWTHGDPIKKEPDFFCDGIPIEFTIASDKKKHDSFVQRLKEGAFNTNDIEQDAIDYIKLRLADKAKKEYSVPNLHLCILFTLELSNWIPDYYGSYLAPILDARREALFKEINSKYIATKEFNNIFIIFPSLGAKWWLFDVSLNQKGCYTLAEDEIISGKYPFLMNKHKWQQSYLKKAVLRQN